MHPSSPGRSDSVATAALGMRGVGSALRRPPRVLPQSPELRGGSSGPGHGRGNADLGLQSHPGLGQRGMQRVLCPRSGPSDPSPGLLRPRPPLDFGRLPLENLLPAPGVVLGTHWRESSVCLCTRLKTIVQHRSIPLITSWKILRTIK